MRHHIMLLMLSDVKTITPKDKEGNPQPKKLLPFAVYKQGGLSLFTVGNA